jgi:hypothetical protein
MQQSDGQLEELGRLLAAMERAGCMQQQEQSHHHRDS